METEASVSETPEISDEFRWNKLALRKFEVSIADTFALLRSAGIEPMLIKGWAANRNYPPEKPRTFSDIDIAVSSLDFDAADDLLGNAPKSVSIDLHRELRHLDTVSWDRLLKRSEIVFIDDTKVRIPAPEDHLRILCTHWLTDGGEYKDRLWDIYYAVANRPKDFDWSICLDSVSDTRRNWILTTIFVAHKFLQLDISGLPFRADIEELPIWMTSCLEKAWSDKVRLRPIHSCLDSPKQFWIQLKKRFPPNAITATIDVEGKFNDSSRVPYQIRSIMKRTLPSLGRLFPAISKRIFK